MFQKFVAYLKSRSFIPAKLSANLSGIFNYLPQAQQGKLLAILENDYTKEFEINQQTEIKISTLNRNFIITVNEEIKKLEKTFIGEEEDRDRKQADESLNQLFNL